MSISYTQYDFVVYSAQTHHVSDTYQTLDKEDHLFFAFYFYA